MPAWRARSVEPAPHDASDHACAIDAPRKTLDGITRPCGVWSIATPLTEKVYVEFMTRPVKKKRERFFVEEAARSLGKTWGLGEDREHPDFIVAEDSRQFGLKVCEIFMGPQNRDGSAMKAKESITQSRVNALQVECEAVANIPLNVRFVGYMSAENIAMVVPALVAENLLPDRSVIALFSMTTMGYACMSLGRFVPIGSA